MSTHTSPPKIPSVPTGTPASEWATTTESILTSGSVKQVDSPSSTGQGKHEVPVMNADSLNTPTPGHEFPGSYPQDLDKHEPQESTSSNSGSIGASVMHAAKQYMPKKVEQTVAYARQTAATYLPLPQTIKDSIASYWCALISTLLYRSVFELIAYSP
jgi:hypothetical protein